MLNRYNNNSRRYRPRYQSRYRGRGRRFGRRSSSFRRSGYAGRPRYGLSLFGDKRTIKMRYHETFPLEPAANLGATEVISANGLFAPSVGVDAHQPRGFDQMMSMYTHFTVMGAKCTASFTQTDGTDGCQAVVAVRGRRSAFNSKFDVLEDRNVSFRTLGKDRTGVPVVVSRTFSTRKFLGKRNPLDDDILQGTAIANPNEEAFFHISVIPLTADPIGVINVSVDIMYVVTFTEPRLPPISIA